MINHKNVMRGIHFKCDACGNEYTFINSSFTVAAKNVFVPVGSPEKEKHERLPKPVKFSSDWLSTPYGEYNHHIKKIRTPYGYMPVGRQSAIMDLCRKCTGREGWNSLPEPKPKYSKGWNETDKKRSNLLGI